MLDSIPKLLWMLDRREKRNSLILLGLIIVGALLELLGVGLLLPFMGLVNDPALVERQKILKKIFEFFGSPPISRFLVGVGVALMLVYVVKNIYAVYLTHLQNKFLANRQAILEKKLFSAYLQRPYAFHLQKNPAELIHNINNVFSVISCGMMPMFIILTEGIVSFFMISFLLVMRPLATAGAIFFLGLSTLVFYVYFRKEVRLKSELRLHEGTQTAKWLNQGFGGIKEIKTLGKEAFFVNSFSKHSTKFVRLGFHIQNISQLPRAFIETITFVGLIFIFVISIVLFENNLQTLMPTLALFAGATIRFMPAINRIVNSMVSIRQTAPVTTRLYAELHASDLEGKNLLEDTSADIQRMQLKEGVEFKNVNFHYAGTSTKVLDSLSFRIPKGKSVAFVGPSGAGKTTIVDLLLGLLTPDSGYVLADGEDITKNVASWRKTVGYIPQVIYLSDDTIRRNVAFGVADKYIDDIAVKKALEAASLAAFIDKLPQGLDTTIGDRGIRLSGGQRQRIGIARAFYLNPDVLILDEATSSLDSETEREINESIDYLTGHKTVVIVAHRLNTVAKCDNIFFLKEGTVIDSGNFKELLNKNSDFKRFANSHLLAEQRG